MCSYGNLQDSNTQYRILVFPQTLFRFNKKLTKMEGKALQSGAIRVPLWFRNYHKIKQLETAGQKLSSCQQEQLHWIQKKTILIFTNRESKLHFKREYPCCLPYIVAIVLSLPWRVRPEIVLFVVHFHVWQKWLSRGSWKPSADCSFQPFWTFEVASVPEKKISPICLLSEVLWELKGEGGSRWMEWI